jgi:hypothetical protein
MCSIHPVNELLFISFQPSAISFQPFSIHFVSPKDLIRSPSGHPNSLLNHIAIPNWGGKDIILLHLSQMFLEKISFPEGHFHLFLR